MGNSINGPLIPPSFKSKNNGTDVPFKRSTSLREQKSTRAHAIPTGEIVDIRMLRLKRNITQLSTNNQHQETTEATANGINKLVNQTSECITDEEKLKKQLDYIHSCARRDKGLLGMMTENVQSKHIFSHNQPENTHEILRTPDDFNMLYKEFYIKTFDNEYIHCYYIQQSSKEDEFKQKDTLLYLHGAGGNLSHRLEVIRLFYDNLGCNCLIIDYRGFGLSTGCPSEVGLYIDAQAAYDYLTIKENIPPEKIIVLGTSLGASVAIQLVSDVENRVKCAIFENPFISVPEIARHFLPYAKNVLSISKSVGFVYLFDSLSKVPKIKCPCIYLVGLLDNVVPTYMSSVLYNETRNAKHRQLYTYEYGRHNDLPIMTSYFDNIHTFLNDIDEKPTPINSK